MNQSQRAERFRELHQRSGAFLLPNPWDIGSALLLQGLGFEALATSSAASAVSIGRKDGGLTREQALAHARSIVEATKLPVSADLERGFGDAPEAVAETVRLAADAGLVGCTIEDSTGNPERPLYDSALALERIAAGAEVVRSLPFPFFLTARAHGLLYPGANLDAVVERLAAFERAGAEVLFAPGLEDLEAVRTVCSAVSKPFNFMAGIPGRSFPVADLAAAGVRRISFATSLYRAAMTALVRSARRVGEEGNFDFVDGCMSTAELLRIMGIG